MSTQEDYAPSPTKWVRDAVEKIETTGSTEAAGFNGQGVVLLTMRGAKTGKIRKVPLMRVEDNGLYAAVASLGGAPKHPVWYYNLKANPGVELQDGESKRDYVAREVSGDEKAVWWERAVETWPDYATYQTRTERQIPVFVLEPVADSAGR
jgi:F420H(2)-dependent quinone reductase